jgi:hypothetical protein
MNIPVDLLTPEQERELDKVNAFYLQKEAEVCRQNQISDPNPHVLNYVVANRHIAQNSTQDPARQEKSHQVAPRHLEALVQIHHSRRRFPAVRYGSEQAPTIC